MWVSRDAEEVRIIVGHMSDNGAPMLKHAEADGLHRMWSELRGERPAPFRAELDAGKIGGKAPFLAIFEHVGPSNFRIRIAGDRLNRWFGLELRGMSVLAMVEGPVRNHMQAALNRVVGDPSVGVIRGAARGLDGQRTPFEMVLLPMRSDFGRIDRVLAGVWLLETPEAGAYPFLLDAQEIHVFTIEGDHLTNPALELSVAPEHPPQHAIQPRAAAERPKLRSVEGGGESAVRPAPSAPDDGPDHPTPPASGPRRGHLRLVKNG